MTEPNPAETYISIDIETDGPIPGDYSMVSFGGCVIGSHDPTDEFYVEIRCMTDLSQPEALAVSGFSRAYLDQCTPADEAAFQIVSWLDSVQRTYPNQRLVMVGFNAAFDWMFVNYYLHHFVGRNPLGIGPLDIKSLYMGTTGCSWGATTMSRLPAILRPIGGLSHNALADAKDQAYIFSRVRASDGQPDPNHRSTADHIV